MKCEFHRGDVICRIGDTEPFIVLDFQEPDREPFPPIRQYRLMKVEEDKWGRTITYYHRFQALVEMTYVKVGKWDFKKNLEVDDEVQ